MKTATGYLDVVNPNANTWDLSIRVVEIDPALPSGARVATVTLSPAEVQTFVQLLLGKGGIVEAIHAERPEMVKVVEKVATTVSPLAEQTTPKP